MTELLNVFVCVAVVVIIHKPCSSSFSMVLIAISWWDSKTLLQYYSIQVVKCRLHSFFFQPIVGNGGVASRGKQEIICFVNYLPTNVFVEIHS